MNSIQFKFKDGTTICFGVAKLPDRKQFALYARRGANIDVLAYFRNDGCVEKFVRLLDLVIEKMNEEESSKYHEHNKDPWAGWDELGRRLEELCPPTVNAKAEPRRQQKQERGP